MRLLLCFAWPRFPLSRQYLLQYPKRNQIQTNDAANYSVSGSFHFLSLSPCHHVSIILFSLASSSPFLLPPSLQLPSKITEKNCSSHSWIQNSNHQMPKKRYFKPDVQFQFTNDHVSCIKSKVKTINQVFYCL